MGWKKSSRAVFRPEQMDQRSPPAPAASEETYTDWNLKTLFYVPNLMGTQQETIAINSSQLVSHFGAAEICPYGGPKFVNKLFQEYMGGNMQREDQGVVGNSSKT